MEGGKPRISLKKTLPICVGGLHFTNIRLYNLQCLMRHALEWLSDKSNYSNITLEREGALHWSLEALLHSKVSALPNHLKTNLFYRDTIIAWRESLLVIGHIYSLLHSHNRQPDVLAGANYCSLKAMGTQQIDPFRATISP